ncbi:MAG: hypothetical protein ACK5NM_14340, partial [Cyclobacteriaceae bacterium]
MSRVKVKNRPFFRALVLAFMFGTLTVRSQEVLVSDTLVTDLLLPIDTTATLLLPSNLEYVPAEATPQVIAERLSALQGKIELTY